MKRCNELKSEYEAEQDFTYDIVIKLRPDLMIREPIPEEVLTTPEKLWFSGATLNPDTQVSDKFALSSSSNMDYYTSVWDHLNEYWAEPSGDGSWEDVRVGERLMRYHMGRSDIATEPFYIPCSILRSGERFEKEIGLRDIVDYIRSEVSPI